MRIHYKDKEGDDQDEDNLNMKDIFLHAKSFEDRSHRQITLTVGQIESPIVDQSQKKCTKHAKDNAHARQLQCLHVLFQKAFQTLR